MLCASYLPHYSSQPHLALHLIFESDSALTLAPGMHVSRSLVILDFNNCNIDTFLLASLGRSPADRTLTNTKPPVTKKTPQRPVMIWEIRDLLITPIPLHHRSKIHGCNQKPSRVGTRALQQLSINPRQTIARSSSSACQSNRTRLGKGQA
jgi:hypothetical protein